MIRRRAWKLWHLSALVVVAALALALVRGAEYHDPFSLDALSIASIGLVGLAFALGPFFAVERIAGRTSYRMFERGRAWGGPAGWMLMALAQLAYFAILLGVAGLGLLVMALGLLTILRV